MADADSELLTRWRDGDKAAGEALFERYYPAMLRFFSNKVAGDPADLIQETFMACVVGEHRLQSVENFRSFLFGIAYNRLKKHYARGRSEANVVDYGTHSAADLSPGASTMLSKSAEQELLLSALRQIPVEHQVVLEMFYWEAFTSAAIAEALQEPHGTIRTRLRRARQLLEEALQKVATDPALAQRTRANLDDWAAKLRAELGESAT